MFVPFGFGKRKCPGDSFAVHSLFIFFVMLLQRVKIGNAAGKRLPDPENTTRGLTRAPKPFYISIVENNYQHD